MENTNLCSSHTVFNFKLHIVFVSKYRRKTLSPELLEYLKEAFADCLTAWRCKLVKFGDEPDHVHLLVDIHPALDISVLINNLKTASAQRTRNRFAEHVAKFYSKPLFWYRACFFGSIGGATLETVRAYVDGPRNGRTCSQGRCQSKNKPVRLTPSCPVGLRLYVAAQRGWTRKGNARTSVQIAVEHAVSVHQHSDSPELRRQLRQMFRDGTPPEHTPLRTQAGSGNTGTSQAH